jgi:peptidoglycan/xylan/chitin deacetylase (PgdA/CDA1 family)
MQEKLPEDVSTRFFRPPGGFVTDGVQQVAQARLQAVLSWSVDPKDWAVKDAAAVERMVLKNVKDGDIILLHDMSDSSVEAAFEIIDALKQQGFRFVTVSELARRRRVTVQPGKTYTCFLPPGEEK